MHTQTAKQSLGSLLNQQTLDRVLTAFSPLLPDITVAILDLEGDVLATFPPGERDTVASLEATTPQRSLILELNGDPIGQLMARGSDLTDVEPMLQALQTAFTGLLQCGHLQRLLAAETLERYREINLLYKVGESINASLDLEEIPDLVLQEARQVIDADAGLVALTNARGQITGCACFRDEPCNKILEHVLADVLAANPSGPMHTEILTDLRLPGEDDVLSTVIMAPMSMRERVLGMVMLGRKQGGDVFIAGERKLLTALVSQTAVAVENARLFASVKEQRDAIAQMNVYMDHIFASLASGVITLDDQDRISFLNQAAEKILEIDARGAAGRSYEVVLSYLKDDLIPLVAAVREGGESTVGYEVQSKLPNRGLVNLKIHISPLQGTDEQTTGVTIVVDDLTEQKQLEAQVQQVRGTFERYVSPRVVEQLLSDPSRVQLGGARQEVTILFADIRGFSTFSERVEAEMLFEILNRHLTLAAEAVLEQEGTLDKFMGDAVMAVFNAPLAQEDHVLRAVRAAWQMKTSISNMHVRLEPGLQLRFGIGISTGPTVVGNVGSPMLQNYTAIGNTVNLASRLQTHAGPGQILLDGEAYAQVRGHVDVQALGQTYFKGHSEPTSVFELLALD